MADYQLRGNLFPIKSAYVGMDCAYCQKKPSKDSMPGDNGSLLGCTGCHHARYCSRKCQSADWKAVGRQTSHKPICKLLKAFRPMHQSIQGHPGADDNALVGLVKDYYAALPMLCLAAGVNPTSDEAAITTAKNFLQGCRVCAICSKTEYDVAAGEVRDWLNCRKCGYGWCCSAEHWEEYQAKGQHSEEICKTYNKSIACERFLWQHVENHNEEFVEVPADALCELMSSFPCSWDEYFALRCNQSWPMKRLLPAPYFPVGTRELSQPVNCLQAMYIHGIENFGSLSTLTIHIVGADKSYEWSPSPTHVWEEIMHCLPAVKKMELIFVGPDLFTRVNPNADYRAPMDLECCPDCIGKGRKRVMTTYAKKWHEYRADKDRYTKPDLVVAFNTGMSMEETDGWVESIKMMIEDDIPCLFTMYQEDEAKGDYDLLQSLGAKIITERNAMNPFAVDIPTIDANRPDTFFHLNERYVCFKGCEK